MLPEPPRVQALIADARSGFEKAWPFQKRKRSLFNESLESWRSLEQFKVHDNN